MNWLHSLLIKADMALDHKADLAQKAIAKAPYVTGPSTVYLGLTADEWNVLAIIVGTVVTFGTGVFNIWFKMKYQRGKK